MSSDSESVASSFDQSSSNKDHSTSTEDLSSNTGTHISKDGQEILSAKETRMIQRSRAIVILVLLISAAVAGIVTFLMVKRSENQNFGSEVSENVIMSEIYRSFPLCTARPGLHKRSISL